MGARLLLVLSIAAWACGGGPLTATPPVPQSQPVPPARLLVVTHTAGFRHDSIPTAEATLRELGEVSRLYSVEYCRTADDVQRRMTQAGLGSVDGVFFANTTGSIGIPDVGAFLQWVGAGHAFLGAHSASDTYHDEPAFLDMLGGEFLSHGRIVATEVRVDDPTHPTVAHFAPRFQIEDELYRFTRFNRSRVTMLLTMDRNPADGVGEAGAAVDLPVAWYRTFGTGRVFYTSLGHRNEVWRDSRFRQHVLEAIRWALRR